MKDNNKIQVFDGINIRTVWNEEEDRWYFSIVDVVAVLTESSDPKQYIKKLKMRDPELKSNWGTICTLVELTSADGKRHKEMTADQRGLFRIIQSIPSPKAEPFKQWMAQVASDRLDQMQDPELNFQQAFDDYRRLGYSERWVNQRLQSIKARKELTDEWERAGVKEGLQYATLTDIITKEWSGKTTRQYKAYKGLRKESLRDNMTTMELALNMLAEATTVEISKAENPKGFRASAEIAHKGGAIAGETRAKIESQTGRSIVSKEKASDYLPPADRGMIDNGGEEK